MPPTLAWLSVLLLGSLVAFPVSAGVLTVELTGPTQDGVVYSANSSVDAHFDPPLAVGEKARLTVYRGTDRLVGSVDSYTLPVAALAPVADVSLSVAHLAPGRNTVQLRRLSPDDEVLASDAIVLDRGGLGFSDAEPFAVGRIVRSLTRPATLAPGGDRSLDLWVWYPAALGSTPDAAVPADEVPAAADTDSLPTLVYSHGSCGLPEQVEYLAIALARRGFVTVSMGHTGNQLGEPACAPPRPNDLDLAVSLVERPGDVVAAIDWALEQSGDPQSILHGLIDDDRIGLAGYSFGGQTVVRIPEIDERVKSLFVMAPETVVLAALTGLPSVLRPIMVMGGDLDTVTPFDAHQVPLFDVQIPPRYLVELLGSGHGAFGFFGTQTERVRILALALPFLRTYLAGDARARLELDFFDSASWANVTVDAPGRPSFTPCSDGLDNEGDGLVDESDPSCAGGAFSEDRIGFAGDATQGPLLSPSTTIEIVLDRALAADENLRAILYEGIDEPGRSEVAASDISEGLLLAPDGLGATLVLDTLLPGRSNLQITRNQSASFAVAPQGPIEPPGGEISIVQAFATLEIDRGGFFANAEGPFGVGVREDAFLHFTTQDPQEQRTIDVIVWYPTDDLETQPDLHGGVTDASLAEAAEALPLVVFSHGLCGTPEQSIFLMVALARAGFVTIAMTHPDSVFGASCLDPQATARSFIERPGEANAARDWLLAANLDPGSPFFGAVDPERVAIAGHSFGGQTTIRLAESDPLYKAALPLAPETLLLQSAGIAELPIPTMIMGGSFESILQAPAPPSTDTPFEAHNQAYYELLEAPRFLVEILRTGHFAFSDGCVANCNPPNTERLTQEEAHAIVNPFALGFLGTYLARDTRWRALITPDPEVALSSDAAPIALRVACSDGIDNDGDERIDWPLDFDCTDEFATSEVPEPGALWSALAALVGLRWLRSRRPGRCASSRKLG